MRIEKIRLLNYRIYAGENEIIFKDSTNANITLIAGKNGFGKTTFLSSLIWGFYGGLMSQVEEKYRREIRNAGGYKIYRRSMLNKNIREEVDNNILDNAQMEVEVHLSNILIPSVPCKSVVIKRSFNYINDKESLKISIDGQENELTKEVGYDAFINDFILPREIAKFFFFDAEKIVTLAEAKTAEELKSLGTAYAEVLGLKKYEDLKNSLKTLLIKYKRSGVSKFDKERFDKLTSDGKKLNSEKIAIENELKIVDERIHISRQKIDYLQEKLIRLGSGLTLEELLSLKQEKDTLVSKHKAVKNKLKSILDTVPIVIAGNSLKKLMEQVRRETYIKTNSLDQNLLNEELEQFANNLENRISEYSLDNHTADKFKNLISEVLKESRGNSKNTDEEQRLLLEISNKASRRIVTMYDYIKKSFVQEFNSIVQEERKTRKALAVVTTKIKEGEARQNNNEAKKYREQRDLLNREYLNLLNERDEILSRKAIKNQELITNSKKSTEVVKNFKLAEADQKKYDVTQKLLNKIEIMSSKIKETKKHSLERNVLKGLTRLMHKSNFISKINVRIDNEIMDIDLIDKNGSIIEKDTLSKGEQQLYATALLKALVDESGIKFPVFIDSPLQKFDKEHSSNIIEQFYPFISKQVVLFPLLEKELSIKEYQIMKAKLAGVYLIENGLEGSTIKQQKIEELFVEFNKQNHAITYSN
ncbi:AAA family ATPase [uncultured Draconibacterium sp.]|uniref:AAA family ATPase n=1 Tax=uncultured Draconibacterium sp. TaxID=1573823 RepID=UPI002AA5F406|nr:AAA family ATPase [uncultured Draconibacterium sp.]